MSPSILGHSRGELLTVQVRRRGRAARGAGGAAAEGRLGSRFKPRETWKGVFGDGPNFEVSDGPSESPPNFERLVLGCIDANFCK